jgi:hypothetical protein
MYPQRSTAVGKESVKCHPNLHSILWPLRSYLVDVLALQLGDELVQTLIISLNTDRFEDLLDIAGGRRGVATKAEEEVSCEMLHFVGVETFLLLGSAKRATTRAFCPGRRSN